MAQLGQWSLQSILAENTWYSNFIAALFRTPLIRPCNAPSGVPIALRNDELPLKHAWWSTLLYHSPSGRMQVRSFVP
jgi:hypothetical protein